MIKVYLTTTRYAEHVCNVADDEVYKKLLPVLEKLAKDNGYDMVTESVDERDLQS